MKITRPLLITFLCAVSLPSQTRLDPSQLKCPVSTGPAVVVFIPTTVTTSSLGGAATTTVVMAASCVILDPAAFKVSQNGANQTIVTLTNPSPAPLPNFTFNEIPVGATDGINAVFRLANAPVPATSLQVFVNGLQQATTGYTVSGNSFTFNQLMQPPAGSTIAASYTYSAPPAPPIVQPAKPVAGN